MAETVPSSWTLKVDFDGEVRRVPELWRPADGAEPTAEAVREIACKLFSLSIAEASTVCLTFQDAKGSAQELTGANFADALAAGGDTRVLRVELRRLPKADDTSPTSGWTEAVSGLAEGIQAVGGRLGRSFSGSAESDVTAESRSTTPAEGFAAVRRRTVERFEEVRGAVEPHLETVNGRLKEVSGLVTDKFQEAHGIASERLGPAAETVTERVAPATRKISEVSGNIAVTLGDSFSCARSRLEPHIDGVKRRASRSQPGIHDSYLHFKDQVVNDFHTARQDMASAMGAGASASTPATASAEDQQPTPEAENPGARDVAAAVVGVLATTVLVPFRVLRLAVAATASFASADSADVAEHNGESEPPIAAPPETLEGDDNMRHATANDHDSQFEAGVPRFSGGMA